MRLAVACALAAMSLACSRRHGESAPPPPPSVTPPPGPPTWWNRVAAITEAHCTTCHAEGGIGPFALSSYADAKEHADDIGRVVAERRMPPWLPSDRACAPLLHTRALAQADIDAITAWVASGAPEGDRASYRAPPPKRSYVAVTGPPSAVAMPDAPYAPVRAGRTDDYHCFVLDPHLTRDQRVVALRIVPGAPAIVHHVLLFEVRRGALDRVHALDAAAPGPGYTCFGGVGVMPRIRPGDLARGKLVDFDMQMVVGWAPGGGATDVAGGATPLPAGTAIHLEAGSELVLQVHYSLENDTGPERTSDRTRVEMWFADDTEARRQAVWLPILRYDFRVPAGVGPDDPRATARGEQAFPLPLTVLGVAPHMHLRGRSIRVDVSSEDHPAEQCVVDVPRWDFHHQEAYWLEGGLRASRASVSCTWDNSPKAQPIVSGRPRAPRDLRWGEGTDDEMCLAFLYATL